jgi:3-isopropylmalate/(R)-2-methylmalate dehydratase large subunit
LWTIKEEIQLKYIKMSTTLFDKVWDSHVVRKIEDGPDVFLLIAISFMKLPVLLLFFKERGISVLYPERTFATADHNTPTIKTFTVEDPLSANQLRALEEFQRIWDQPLGLGDNGIVHVVGPENGITLPGYYCLRRFILPPRCLWCHCFWWYFR